MTRRRALIVFAAALALLVALDTLVYSLYQSELEVVRGALADRLNALGTTSAKWLATGGDPDSLLDTLVAENDLEDAYVVDREHHVIAGVRTRPPATLNLLRVDEARLAAAFEGRASVGDGYNIANARVETGYFPADDRVLALEAGAEFHAPTRGVRTRYLVAIGLTALTALVFAAVLLFALRALERARVAHGRAERLAAVGQMAAMVAHEVRNPLGILRGQVELAHERLPESTPPRERERFTEMLAEIERMNRLTEEFLGLARDTPLDNSEVDVQTLITRIAEEVRAAAREQEAQITVVPAPAPITVTADETKLRQAIRNLVLNAVQVSGHAARVTIETASEPTRVRITVVDEGPGVPPELAASLFEPFVTARPGGSGLGLAVARRVAERHDGVLVLESTPGARGARFSIYLPRQRT